MTEMPDTLDPVHRLAEAAVDVVLAGRGAIEAGGFRRICGAGFAL